MLPAGCAGAGTGGECAVLMSAARLQELSSIPALVLLFFPLRCRGRLVVEPRFSPTGLRALWFVSLAAKTL